MTIKNEDKSILLFFIQIEIVLKTLDGQCKTEWPCYLGDSPDVNLGQYEYVPIDIQVSEFKKWISRFLNYVNTVIFDKDKKPVNSLFVIEDIHSKTDITGVIVGLEKAYVIVRLDVPRGFLARIPVHIKKINNTLTLLIGSSDFHARIADRPVTEHANSVDRLLTRVFNQRVIFNG